MLIPVLPTVKIFWTTYSMVGGLPDFTENKLSITYPRSWYDATAKRLYREGGEPEKAELIGNKIEVPKGRARNRW